MEKEERLVADVLEDDWKKIYLFLENNKNSAKITQIVRFANILSLFKFDTAYKHSKKQMFVHHNGEWLTSSRPWRRCERSVIFERLENGVSVCIASKVDGQPRINEQSLELRKNPSGEYVGLFNKLNDDNSRTEYTFAVAKNGLIKSKSFKASTNNKKQERTK